MSSLCGNLFVFNIGSYVILAVFNVNANNSTVVSLSC